MEAGTGGTGSPEKAGMAGWSEIPGAGIQILVIGALVTGATSTTGAWPGFWLGFRVEGGP